MFVQLNEQQNGVISEDFYQYEEDSSNGNHKKRHRNEFKIKRTIF